MSEVERNRTHRPMTLVPVAGDWFAEVGAKESLRPVVAWVLCRSTTHEQGRSTVSEGIHGYVISDEGLIECAQSYTGFVRYRR